MGTKSENAEECRKASEALSAHFDGVASDAEKMLATAHLANCSSCARMWNEWQDLRLMEQQALEPAASGEMLPLAPVKVPRRLKAAILQQTVSEPIWMRLWPRLLTGLAVPTVVLGCWLLIMATPWQQSTLDMTPQPNPLAEDSVVIPDYNPAPQRAKPDIKNSSENKAVDLRKANPSSTAPSSIHAVPNATTQIQKHQRLSNSISPTPKSTFRTPSPSRAITVKPPQISMASFDRPRSRAATQISQKAVKSSKALAPKPRATEPVLVAYLPADEASDSEDIDPMVNYIAQNDVRPDDIRQAVENYRAALLDDGSDL